jgi:hemerythrin-like domain-containing protein
MSQTIESMMLDEHKRLDRLLDKLERDLDDFEKTKKNCSKFKWNLEKHFFIEEKIIFDSFITMSGQETSDTFHLLEDHVRIMELLKIIEKRLHKKIKPKLHYLKQIIQTHRTFEDQDFYPNLDEKLTPEQRKEVSKRIKEIIKG